MSSKKLPMRETATTKLEALRKRGPAPEERATVAIESPEFQCGDRNVAISQQIREAILEEREACAQAADDISHAHFSDDLVGGWKAAFEVRDAIRARGES